VTTPFDAAEAFAYVDNCLSPGDRRAFEARLRDDPELRRRVGLWESQNRAIRAAFGAAASARAAIGLAGASNENLPAWMASANPLRRNADAPRASGEARTKPRAASASGPRKAAAARAPGSVGGRRVLAIAALAAGLLAAGATGGPTGPRVTLADAGLAAYRAFAASDAPVEFSASDPETLAQWLSPQIGARIAVPRFSSDALTLAGGRIAPGTTGRAAFLVYEDRRGDRVGLLIEPLDAPAPSAPTLLKFGGVSLAAWTDAGRGLVVVGARADEVVALTRLVDETPAAR
jgi:anti-sigma factor RsiW